MDKNIDLKKIINIYLKQWKWFVLSCVIFITLAFFKLRYTAPEYNAYAKIMLVGDNGVSNPAEEVLQDLGKIPNKDSKKVEDEIEVLRSRRLMEGVVKRLDLNKTFFAQGRIHNTEYFPLSKAPLKINFLESDTLINRSKLDFSLNVISETEFDIIYLVGEQELKKKGYFGKNVDSPIGDILITPNTSNLSSFINQIFYFRLRPINRVAESYRASVKVKQVSEFSMVLNLSLDDRVVSKAKAVLDTLIDEYNRTSIEEKSAKSNNTAEFINKRINLIASDLGKVDDEIEQFKTGNKLTDISSEASLYLQSNAQTEQSLVTARTEYNKINFMKNQLNVDSFERIPANIGLANGALNTIASKYNELLDNRNRLLKSSNEKNPIIVNLDQQLKSLKNSLQDGLDNSAETVGLQIKSLENQSSKLNSKIYAVPGQVRKSRDIQREQGIKESLYLYLLQKREEATISLISTSPNAKIVDSAHSNYFAVSPNSSITYFTFFVLGLCIPFGFIYLKDLLDSKIHNKEDLQNKLRNITVLGEIPRLNKGNKMLIEINDRSILSESFRIIRTNADYIRKGRKVKNYDNVIFVTSTINGEGKSFFSMNMALTIANTGKKVLLVGADIRNPQIFPAIKNVVKDKDSKNGLTEFLVENSLQVNDIINRHKVNDIDVDVLLSGKVPPNPAELLMGDRVKELFDIVSKEYDYVIVDTAPSMLVTDTILISQYAGHTIYLTRANYTEKEILNFANELHETNKLNGMMLVVNDVKQSNFGYGAKYGYYGAPKKKKWYSLKRT
ncbi:GumC family protein [Hyunsoonleella pacifica]|uniref:non-specific protein-tyrosine kinase n=1 Tax=Hyunsoonleella pacifica TaxID=1080224 RepID=A0A4Q9FTT5_9FLAO|nr:tyrosine-protein kinase family protein [Hyunsoonleella pacifica]TBN17682.1 polysaccharide biosynthesis tyrosine autokinase [Hyunsoonleella pacifica]GGD09883.1 tyrosine protein kinase [Hyunsoonleella pacifica]